MPETEVVRLMKTEDRELTWTEKFSLVENELIKNPARSDGLISRQIGVDKVSKASVYRIREALVADGRVKHVPLELRMSVTGNLSRLNGASDSRNGNGNRILVPEGRTVFDLGQEGLKAEEDGMLAQDVASLVGLGLQSYREIRAIVLLSEHPHLSPEEIMLVRECIEEMNTTRRSHAPFKRLKTLADRVWGNDISGSNRTRKSAARRSASFSHAMTIVIDACMAAPDIHVPLMSRDERANAVRQINEAVFSLRKLKRKVVEGRSQ